MGVDYKSTQTTTCEVSFSSANKVLTRENLLFLKSLGLRIRIKKRKHDE